MKVKHLDHLNLSVASFEITADWYCRVFGFEVVENGQYRGRPWGVLKSGEAMLCLYEDPERIFADGDALRAKGLHGPNHFAIRITDRLEWDRIVERENIKVEYGGAYRWPHSTSWYISDPTGYSIEVVLWDGDTVVFDSSPQMAKV